MRYIVAIIWSVFPFGIFAQISEGGHPLCKIENCTLKSSDAIASFSLSSMDKSKLIAEDSVSLKSSQLAKPMRYAIGESCNINIKNGKLSSVNSPNGKIWQYKIVADGAYSIQITFKRFMVPDGARLFIYNPMQTQVIGAFSKENMTDDSTFVISDFPDDSLIIEYFEPNNASFEGEIIIGEINQAYRNLFGDYSTNNSSIDSDGYIGINCPEALSWRNQKHAVCRMTISLTSGGRATCTGSLINNTNQDGKPYFLTAHHCISDDAGAKSMAVYFNLEETECNGTAKSAYQTMTGSSLLTTAPDDGSDYTLLLLNSTPSTSYQPYYAGWDATGNIPTSTTGIHHPNWLPKKISFDNSPAVIYSNSIDWDEGANSPVNTHWQVNFTKGKTYGGSSGSPLFNQNKFIIGQLHGGDKTYDYYGMLSYSWNKPASGYNSLQSYLNPSNNTKVFGAYIPSTNLPDIRFINDISKACLNAPVQFTDYTAFLPSSWTWEFSPNTVSYLNGSSSSSQNPVVAFTAEGNYTVSLIAKNSGGTDTLTKTNLITSGQSLAITAEPIINADSCICSFSKAKIIGHGAAHYYWSLQNNSSNKFQLLNDSTDTIEVAKITGQALVPNDNIEFLIIGKHGSCTDSVNYTDILGYRTNDNIANATTVNFGKYSSMSNYCATVETNEPAPPVGSCDGQLSWCDEYNDGTNIVEHSVWFKFIPSKSVPLTISADDFDTQIAIYQAETYSDVLSGNYTLIAANDDQSTSVSNAHISGVSVTAGKTYWIQMDGSGGGLQGLFSLTLDDATSVTESIQNAFIIYPQPTHSIAYVQNTFSNYEEVSISLYNLSGSLMYSKKVESIANHPFILDMGNFKTGMYLIKLKSEKEELVGKIIKQ